MSEFQFATAAKIVFGCGTSSQLGQFVKDLNAKRIFIMHYKRLPQTSSSSSSSATSPLKGLHDLASIERNTQASVPAATIATPHRHCG